MGELVDLKQFQVNKKVETPIAVWVPTESTGGRELRFAGGPRDGLTAWVGNEVETMMVPGNLTTGELDWRGEWDGKYLYRRFRQNDGDVMQYAGPTEKFGDEGPQVILQRASDMPGAYQWDDA